MEGDEGNAEAAVALIERTLLFTDIERSTERWDADGESMRVLLRHHDDLITEVVHDHRGDIVKRTGDGAVAMFERSLDALLAAIEVQRRLPLAPDELHLAVPALSSRMGLHRGVVEPRLGDLHGPPMHRCARIMSAGHGGQILVSKVVADDLLDTMPPSLPIRLEDRGTHRLKGLHEPEQINQVIADGLDHDFPVLITQNASAGWLPSVTRALVGRQHELAAILTLLEPGRIVTLVGTGGVGKTSLAVHVAQAARPDFPDGAWFVDLAVVTERGRVLSAIADALELAVEGTANVVDIVRHALTMRRALLVVDNCEHLLDDVATALQAVLCSVSMATVLCTSQRDLGVHGETVVAVSPLPHASGGVVSPSAELFIQQAMLADPAFAAGADEHATVERICSRLDGLPLAIELAAARVRTMPLAAIADRLEATFDLLRSRDQPDRHRTLTAAIGWSTNLLEPADRSTLLSLAVFSGAFDWQAAAAVAGGDEYDVVDSLDELVHRSLITRVAERFRLLAPMRLFCLDALTAEGRLDECRARHARHMTSTVPVPLDHPDAHVLSDRMDALIESVDDLRAAFAWHLTHEPSSAADLALSLVDFWVTRGRGQEGYEWLTRADLDALPVPLRLQVLGWSSAFCWVVGRNEECESTARRAIAMAAEPDLPYPPLAGSRLAVRLAFSGHTSEAIEAAELSEASLRSGAPLHADHTYEARIFGVLAVVYAVGGLTARAVALADEGIVVARSVGTASKIASLSNRMLLTPGDDSTLPMVAEVAELARITGRMSAQGHSTLAAAHHHRRRGDLVGFINGLADFCDVMLAGGEHTAAYNGLEYVPEVLKDSQPREAAVFLAALDALSHELALPGTDASRAGLRTTEEELVTMLGTEAFAIASAAGHAMSMEEAVDRLRWVADHQASTEGP